MFKLISVLIPFRPDHPSRVRSFHWILQFYRELLPDAEICVGTCKTQLFSKSRAINQAAKQATRDIFVIADADMFYDPHIIKQAVNLLDRAAWVIPYKQVLDISENSTKQLLAAKPHWPVKMHLEVKQRTPRTVGGINVVPRKHFEAVGGWDERFVGWGGADDAFFCALETMCGRHKRLDHFIYHLWHKPLKAKSNPNYAYNYSLAMQYFKAYKNKSLMQKILNAKHRNDKARKKEK